jgi:hypothetical protein
MTEENYNQNQTQFSVDEPILEKPVEPILEEVVVAKKKPLPKYAYLIIGGVVFVLVILILAIINRPKETIVDEPEIVPTPTMTQELSPIEKKLKVAEDRLEDANPTTEKYPFPPINTELRIDEAR